MFKIRPQIININSNKTLFYSYSVKINQCINSCNNINNLYATLCIFDAIHCINVEVFNLISRTNETRHTKWHENVG